MNAQDVIVRLFFAVVVAGIIGAEREIKNRPAGIKTHIIVCLGATLVAILQAEISNHLLETSMLETNVSAVIRSDPTRLIAQVVSGVGFLGAGTIIVTNNNVTGLTTAASLWVVACLGLVIGMGHLQTAMIGFIFIVSPLFFLKYFKPSSRTRRIALHFTHRTETQLDLKNYFDSHKIVATIDKYHTDLSNGETIYQCVYSLDIDKSINENNMIEDISNIEHILSIELYNH